MKVAINVCFGGFGLSQKAERLLAERGCPFVKLIPPEEYYKGHQDEVAYRKDPVLIGVIEELGAEANGRFAKLKIVNVPDGKEISIHEYDGLEHVEEVHETWS